MVMSSLVLRLNPLFTHKSAKDFARVFLILGQGLGPGIGLLHCLRVMMIAIIQATLVETEGDV